MVLAASLAVSFGFWYHTIHITAAVDTKTFLAEGRPIGNNSDLYPFWIGARALFLRGQDPYSAEVTREIQIGFYGRPLDPQNPRDPIDKESFVYPLYVLFFLFPFVTLPFPIVVEIFRWLLLGSIALSVPLWLRAFGFRARWQPLVAGMLLATSTPPAVEEYFQQNLSALVILFLAAAAVATTMRRLTLAGFLLALSVIKPNTASLMVLYFLLWSVADWRQRQRLVWAFAATLAALVIGAEVVSPGWIGRFLTAARGYSSYGTDPNILQVLFPPLLAMLIAVVLILLLILVCWRWKNAPAGSDCFTSALAWTSAVTLVLLPKLAAYNGLLLLPAMLALLMRYSRSPQSGFVARALAKSAFACLLWQWGTATLLSVASFILPAAWIQKTAHVPGYTFFAMWPITLLALVSSTLSLRSERTQPPGGRFTSV